MHWDLPFFVGMTNSRNMILWLWERALNLQLSIYKILFLVFEGMMLEKHVCLRKEIVSFCYRKKQVITEKTAALWNSQKTIKERIEFFCQPQAWVVKNCNTIFTQNKARVKHWKSCKIQPRLTLSLNPTLDKPRFQSSNPVNLGSVIRLWRQCIKKNVMGKN